MKPGRRSLVGLSAALWHEEMDPVFFVVLGDGNQGFAHIRQVFHH
jgi:hypothetical protein